MAENEKKSKYEYTYSSDEPSSPAECPETTPASASTEPAEPAPVAQDETPAEPVPEDTTEAIAESASDADSYEFQPREEDQMVRRSKKYRERAKAAEEARRETEEEERKRNKRLHRSRKDRVITGVFGGLGEMTGINPWLFRGIYTIAMPLAFIYVNVAAYFVFPLVYLAIGLIMPLEKDPNAMGTASNSDLGPNASTKARHKFK